MKGISRITEVRYSRLFSIGDYENEKISLAMEIAPEDTAQKRLGELFMEVIDIEKMLETYRKTLQNVENRWAYLENSKRYIARTEAQIENKKVKIHEIAELLKKQTINQDEAVEQRLRNACDTRTLRDLKRQLEMHKERFEKNKSDLEEAQRIQGELEKRISAGNFSLEGIEKPKHSNLDLII